MTTWSKSWTKQHDGIVGMGGKGDDEFTFNIPSGYAFTSANASVTAGRENPGVRIDKKPSPGDRGDNKKIKVHWWFDGAMRPFIKYQATVRCTSGSDIRKSQRVLLVVCELATFGRNDLLWLYQSLENAPSVVQGILGDDYRELFVLRGNQATKNRFIEKLESLGGVSSNKAIDVILILHGSPESLWFKNGEVNVSDLESAISELNLKDRLRACFSTACYGATHAPELVSAGFDVACGARGVYANGAFGLPTLLSQWAQGSSFSRAVREANNEIIRTTADGAARLVGFRDADSYLNVYGDGTSNICSRAD